MPDTAQQANPSMDMTTGKFSLNRTPPTSDRGFAAVYLTQSAFRSWRSVLKTLDRTSQMLRDERQTSNIDIATATGDDVVNHQPTFTCITCKARRRTPEHFARIDDSYFEMDRQPIFNSGDGATCPRSRLCAMHLDLKAYRRTIDF